MSDLKGDYSLKESQFKTHKTQVKTLQTEIEALKAQYDEAKEGLNEIKVCFSSLFFNVTLLLSQHVLIFFYKGTRSRN